GVQFDMNHNILKVDLPLGPTALGPTAHVAFNLLFEEGNGTSFAISNDNVQLAVGGGGQAAGASAVAAVMNSLLGALPGPGSFGVTAAATNLGGGLFEVTITPGSHALSQLCGGWAVFVN